MDETIDKKTESQVSRELGHLKKTAEELSTVVDSLFERLDRVLTQEPIIEKDMGPDRTDGCRLAEEIISSRESVQSDIRRINNLLERLEL